MTPDQMTAALDAMQQAAGSDPDLRPGLIAVKSAAWCDSLYAIERITRGMSPFCRQQPPAFSPTSCMTRDWPRFSAGPHLSLPVA